MKLSALCLLGSAITAGAATTNGEMLVASGTCGHALACEATATGPVCHPAADTHLSIKFRVGDPSGVMVETNMWYNVTYPEWTGAVQLPLSTTRPLVDMSGRSFTATVATGQVDGSEQVNFFTPDDGSIVVGYLFGTSGAANYGNCTFAMGTTISTPQSY